jgi:chromosome segregation ATPase
MLTPAQLHLAEAIDAMRADEATIVVLTRDLESTRAERDAYYKHLEQSQAEVARLQETVTALRLRVFELETPAAPSA